MLWEQNLFGVKIFRTKHLHGPLFYFASKICVLRLGNVFREPLILDPKSNLIQILSKGLMLLQSGVFT